MSFLPLVLSSLLIICCQDPAIATSKRVGNASYESYDRGTAQNAWVFESDGKTPLLGEVGPLTSTFHVFAWASHSCSTIFLILGMICD